MNKIMINSFNKNFQKFVSDNKNIIEILHEQFLKKNKNITYEDTCKFLFYNSA